MAVVPRHCGADYRVFLRRDEQHVVVCRELCVEYLRWRVVRGIVGEHSFP